MKSLLQETRTIAVVGLSDKPNRPSYDVAQYMQSHGYKIIPINPNCQQILGETCYPDLKSVPAPIDMVNVFRKAEDCWPVAKEAVEVGAKSLWLQLGISNQEAADYAQQHGLKVVMNRCIKIDHMREML
jgi:predicted CoA-binding protein